jgi:hypothetical protein
LTGRTANLADITDRREWLARAEIIEMKLWACILCKSVNQTSLFKLAQGCRIYRFKALEAYGWTLN